uniref:olfactory receptor 10AG1-like n=1 Tax=Jaculus jaculus TaxID=51337 RepID=UPI001E1AFDDB|nr:olfactory receptor 10AG1-like [Jaculus jaculus]
MQIYQDGKRSRTENRNISTLTEFVLVGFSDSPHIQWILFGIFLLMYLTILMSNSIIILITALYPVLQIPMYFFLSNFSFVEICYVTVTIPRMLVDLCTQRGNISLFACATQMCFILMLGGTECLLLSVMSYDRYVAICNPLHYAVVMSHRVCMQLVAACWGSVIPVVIGQTYQIFSLPFCGSNKINHFICDIPPVLKLACGDTFVNEMAVYVVAMVFVMVPFLLIIVSYGKIISSILKLSSAKGRAKAFSTCSSHLIVVVLFYGTASITYLQPKPNQSDVIGKLLSLFYTVLIPLLNPVIYTLRNKDIMSALKKLVSKKLVIQLKSLWSNFNNEETYTYVDTKSKEPKNITLCFQFYLLEDGVCWGNVSFTKYSGIVLNGFNQMMQEEVFKH